jgi:hypothetical protein
MQKRGFEVEHRLCRVWEDLLRGQSRPKRDSVPPRVPIGLGRRKGGGRRHYCMGPICRREKIEKGRALACGMGFGFWAGCERWPTGRERKMDHMVRGRGGQAERGERLGLRAENWAERGRSQAFGPRGWVSLFSLFLFQSIFKRIWIQLKLRQAHSNKICPSINAKTCS